MAFGLRVLDGRGALLGIWWTPDEAIAPEPLYLDDWEQHIADGHLYDAQAARDAGTLAPVLRAGEDTAVPADWLDFLAYLARPTLHALTEQVDGPFITDAGSAQELLDVVKSWDELPAGLKYAERSYSA